MVHHHILEPLSIYKEVLDYNLDTGAFTWIKRVNSKVPAGSIAGSLDKNGHVQIRLKGVMYMAHRLAYYFMTGEDPGDMQIDHINLDKSDNRWENLRLATPTQNNANVKVRSHNQIGLKGVGKASSGKYRARITFNKREIYLGTFDTPELAYAAYVQKANELYGDFAHS